MITPLSLPARVPLLLAVLALIFQFTAVSSMQAVDEPGEIKQLAGMLRQGPNSSEMPAHMLAIVARLHGTWLKLGLRPAEQLDRALRLNKASATDLLATRASAMEAYEEANALGLFTEVGFKELKSGSMPKVQQGPHTGKMVKVYRITDSPELKKFEKRLAAWRVGVEGEELSVDAKKALDVNTAGRLNALRQAQGELDDRRSVKDEAKRERAEDAAEFDAKFKAAQEAAAAAGEGNSTSVTVRGQFMQAASKLNKQRILVEGTVANTSKVPLDATLEWYIIGRSAGKKRMMNLGQKIEKLRLLPGGWKDFEALSISLNGKTARNRTTQLDSWTAKKKGEEPPDPRYLGWIIRVISPDEKVLAYRTSGLSELEEMAKDPQGMTGMKRQDDEMK